MKILVTKVRTILVVTIVCLTSLSSHAQQGRQIKYKTSKDFSAKTEIFELEFSPKIYPLSAGYTLQMTHQDAEHAWKSQLNLVTHDEYGEVVGEKLTINFKSMGYLMGKPLGFLPSGEDNYLIFSGRVKKTKTVQLLALKLNNTATEILGEPITLTSFEMSGMIVPTYVDNCKFKLSPDSSMFVIITSLSHGPKSARVHVKTFTTDIEPIKDWPNHDLGGKYYSLMDICLTNEGTVFVLGDVHKEARKDETCMYRFDSESGDVTQSVWADFRLRGERTKMVLDRNGDPVVVGHKSGEGRREYGPVCMKGSSESSKLLWTYYISMDDILESNSGASYLKIDYSSPDRHFVEVLDVVITKDNDIVWLGEQFHQQQVKRDGRNTTQAVYGSTVVCSVNKDGIKNWTAVLPKYQRLTTPRICLGSVFCHYQEDQDQLLFFFTGNERNCEGENYKMVLGYSALRDGSVRSVTLSSDGTQLQNVEVIRCPKDKVYPCIQTAVIKGDRMYMLYGAERYFTRMTLYTQ